MHEYKTVGRQYGHQFATVGPSRGQSTRKGAGQSTFALVAQGIEHRFPKPCVACSNHAEGASLTSTYGPRCTPRTCWNGSVAHPFRARSTRWQGSLRQRGRRSCELHPGWRRVEHRQARRGLFGICSRANVEEVDPPSFAAVGSHVSATTSATTDTASAAPASRSRRGGRIDSHVLSQNTTPVCARCG
jgi:hypothetical protein